MPSHIESVDFLNSIKTFLSLTTASFYGHRNKQGDRGDMPKIHMTWQYFEATGPQGHFFEKKQKTFFRYGLEECVYQISGPYRVWFGHGVDT